MANDSQAVEEKLDEIINLLQSLLALELSRSGVPHGVIGKHLRVAKSKVGKILGGVKKERKTKD
ncbi:MAG TPA: hypothetical protein VKV04_17025 [Verrucomicrobiae bacterium]|nr:hypothetical protein [Verrucomicrobiae bacterium]